MKRFCCMLLCLCMLIPILSIQGFADDTVQESDAAQGVSITPNSTTNVVVKSEGNCAKMYLSDFPVSSMLRCNVGWGSYMRDRNIDNNGSVSLKMSDGSVKYFEKSVAAHASADMIYDFGAGHTYDTFHSWVGVDARKGSNGDGVTFKFYLSNDGITWGSPLTWTGSDIAYKGDYAAAEVTFNIKGYRYFRVVCNKGKTDSYDHSSLGDAMVYDSTKVYTAPQVSLPSPGTLTIDGDANQAGFKSVVDNETSELALLQYMLFQKCGTANLEKFFTASSDYKERVNAFNWLYNNHEALKEFMNGGAPNDGSYISALEVFASIYAVHSEDLNDTKQLYLPDSEHVSDTRGDLYRRMMLSLSLVCAGGWSGWMSNAGIQNPVKRYEYFKENYTSTATNADGTTSDSKMRCDIFENLGVDEMRWVVGNNIANAEIVWLNDYARKTPRGGNQTSYPILYSPHHHISYRWYNYDKDEFYADENKDTYCNKYYLTGYEKYGLTYGLTDGMKVQRLWMVFEDGAVCGNISRTGANLGACFGVPACEVGQPGHAAFLIMGANSSTGEMIWGIDNDISGWMSSTNSRRMPCDWGLNGDSWISGCRASYVLLSQAALNHLSAYSKAEEIMMMYEYCTNDAQREACCRAALSYMQYHLDTWLKLVQMYCADSTKTASELTDLAEELCADVTGTDIDTCMCYYPKPMYDLMQLIINRIKTMSTNAGNELSTAETNLEDNPDDESLKQAKTDAENKKIGIEVELANCQMILNTALKRAASTTDAAPKCAQPSACRQNANYFLSNSSYNLATFSFDGDNANKIVFNSDFTSVRFKICLNKTAETPDWGDSISVYADSDGVVSYDLTDRLSEINQNDDIYIWLDGWSGDPNFDDAFCIDIKAGSTVSGLDFNDNENHCFGTTDNVEYHLEDENKWKELTTATVIEGAHTVTVRKKANGTTLMGAESTFTTTAENTASRVYIPISRMSVAAYSSEETSKNDYAKYVIDGKTTTRWHTLWNKSDTAKYITLKTDTPAYFTGMDYTPVSGGGNGTIYSAVVEVSLDGSYWMTAANVSGWGNNGDTKHLTFSPVYGQYVRVRVTDSCGGFVSARKFELFENVTLKDKQITGITLETKPSKLEYIKGEMLDLTGASAKVVYADGSHAVLPVSMLSSDTPILNTVSDSYLIRLRYGRYSTFFHVKVSERTDFTPTSITIVTEPDQTSLYTNESLDPTGMTITATDGTTTIYLSSDEYTLSGNTKEAADNVEITVTLNNTELTATYYVTVKKCIDRIELVTEPEKNIYDLGDAFVDEGISVQAVYLKNDNKTVDYTRILDETEYELEGVDTFSEHAGTQTINVVLSDNSSVSTHFTVQVYPRFTYDGVLYSADETGNTCSVASIVTIPEDGFVSIPETVIFGSTTYTVTAVAEDALSQSAGVKAIALPSTVTALAEHALDGGEGLTTLYLTAHTDFSNLSVAENSLNPNVEIKLYASSEELSNELGERLVTVVPEFGEKVKVGNVQSEIKEIRVTPPAAGSVPLGFDMLNMDWSGYSVTAVLKDGNTVPLAASSCSRTEIDTSKSGEKTVTVSLKISDTVTYAANFNITVLESNLYFETNPEGAFYFSTQDTIQPLTALATASDSPELIYSWYRSADGTRNPETDRIPNASGTSYMPEESGFYYAGATIKGTEFTVYSLTAEIDIGNYAAIAGNKNSDGTFTWIKGYDSLNDALSSSATGDYVKLTRDIVLSSMVTVGRNVTLLGDGYTVTRGSSLTGSMFYLSGKTLTADDITLDGGANWHGTSDQYSSELLRYWLGTQYSGTIIKCSGAAVLNLESGAVLCNNYNVSSDTKNTTGGAIYAEGTSIITINGAKLLDCWSKLFGSAIYARDNTVLIINDGEIKGNSGTGDGSGNYNTSVICVDNNCVCTVNGGWFHHNAGVAKGGIFWVSNGKLSIKGGTFENNIATNGSTVYLNGSATVELGGDFQMQDVYLPNGKTVTITDEIQPGSVNIVTQTKTVGTDAVIVNEGVELSSVLEGITINGATPGYDESTGRFQTACTNGHTYALVEGSGEHAKKTITSGTCLAPGLVYEYCSVCGAMIGEPIQNQGEHCYKEIEAENPTCTEDGHESGKECTLCGHVEGCNVIKSTGHAYCKEHKDSTCTTHGKNVYVCSKCQDSYEEELDILGHDYKIVDGVSTCIRCGDKRNDTLPDNNQQQTESGSVIPTAEESALGISETDAKNRIETTVDNNTSVSNYESPDMSNKVNMETAKSALQDASKTVAEDFDVTKAETSVYAQVTVKEAKIETRTFSSEGKTAITKMTFDVNPVISTLVMKTSGTDSWKTLLTAVIPNDAITDEVSFRLPIDSSIPAGSSVIVWHHNDATGEKNYFGTYSVKAEGDYKYVQLESKEFSTYSYELPGDGYELEGLARSLTINESLSINYKIKVNGYTDAYMVFEFFDATLGENGEYVETRVDTCKTGSYNGSNCLVFSFEGVNPQRMMDNLKATLYAKYGDETVSYTFSDYSVKKYLANMSYELEKSAYASTRAYYYELFGNLIAYGAEAQTSQNYEKDNLISTAFKDNANYVSKDYDADEDKAIKKLTKKDGGVSIKSATLVLSGYVGVRVFFTLEEGVSLEDVKFTASIDGRTTEDILTYDADDFTLSGERYYFTIRGITATEFESVITVQAYVKNTPLTTLSTSTVPDAEAEPVEESAIEEETSQNEYEPKQSGETEETEKTVKPEATESMNEAVEQNSENTAQSCNEEVVLQTAQTDDTQEEFREDDVVFYNVYSYLTNYMEKNSLVKALFNYGCSASALKKAN